MVGRVDCERGVLSDTVTVNTSACVQTRTDTACVLALSCGLRDADSIVSCALLQRNWSNWWPPPQGHGKVLRDLPPTAQGRVAPMGPREGLT